MLDWYYKTKGKISNKMDKDLEIVQEEGRDKVMWVRRIGCDVFG